MAFFLYKRQHLQMKLKMKGNKKRIHTSIDCLICAQDALKCPNIICMINKEKKNKTKKKRNLFPMKLKKEKNAITILYILYEPLILSHT